MKVAFPSLYFVKILPVLKSVAFTWCFEWVTVVETVLSNFLEIFRNSNFVKYSKTLY